jgi:hypothetical protein
MNVAVVRSCDAAAPKILAKALSPAVLVNSAIAPPYHQNLFSFSSSALAIQLLSASSTVRPSIHQISHMLQLGLWPQHLKYHTNTTNVGFDF